MVCQICTINQGKSILTADVLVQTLPLPTYTLDRLASLGHRPQADPFSHISRAGGLAGFASEPIRVNKQTPADGLPDSEAAERVGMLLPAEP